MDKKTVFFLVFAGIVVQTVSASTHVIGEAGLESGLSGDEWQSVSLDSSKYDSTPLVFTTTQTTEGSEDPSSAHVRSVSTSGFETQHCEYDSWGCDSHDSETNAWLALDPQKVRESVGMDGGTVTISGDGTASVSFRDEHIDSTPIVIAQVQTNNGDLPVNAKVISVDSDGATIELCEQDSEDDCDGGHTSETVAWFAVTTEEANRVSGMSANWEDVVDSEWIRTSFDVSFGSTPGVQATSQTQDGGGEDLIPEVDDVDTDGADIRYCEPEGDDDCDTHEFETVGYIAVESGDVSGNKHMCNTSDMETELRAKDGSSVTTVTSFSHVNDSGSCTDGDSSITEIWQSGVYYDYCPLEGSYDAKVSGYTEGSSYSWESSDWFSDLYSVDYDVKEWCECGDSYSDNNYTWLYTDIDESNVGSYGCCEDDNVLWYDFESSEDYPVDLVDRNESNDGSFVNGAEKREVSTPPYSGKKVAWFDGTDSRIEISDNSSLDLTREFSISAWIKHQGSSSDQIIVNKEDAYKVAVNSEGNLKWAFHTDGSWRWEDTEYSVPENEWHHVIFSYDGVETTVYVDGDSESTMTDEQGGPLDTNDNPVWIGGREGGSNDPDSWFDGYIDEVRIFSSAVGSEEASNLHEKGLLETWTSYDTNNPACVSGETVQDEQVSSGRRYLVEDGEIYYCKPPAKDSVPESFMKELHECNFITLDSATYYCGAGGTDKEGKWYTLPDSGCSEVTKIRGGRIRVR